MSGALRVFGGLCLAPVACFAAGPDFSIVTAAVDFGTIVLAVLMVGVSGVGVVVLMAAVRDIYRMIKGV